MVLRKKEKHKQKHLNHKHNLLTLKCFICSTVSCNSWSVCAYTRKQVPVWRMTTGVFLLKSPSVVHRTYKTRYKSTSTNCTVAVIHCTCKYTCHCNLYSQDTQSRQRYVHQRRDVALKSREVLWQTGDPVSDNSKYATGTIVLRHPVWILSHNSRVDMPVVPPNFKHYFYRI